VCSNHAGCMCLNNKHVKQPSLKPVDLGESDEAILASIATETVLPTDLHSVVVGIK
jgi:hypothetical protein